MKIAFISYEYPLDTAIGGIATYNYQAANLMQQRGHQVEVFSGSSHRSGCIDDNGVVVHLVKSEGRSDFAEQVVSTFVERHHELKFDVIESPEIGAESFHITNIVPDVPLVVKLHTPSFLLSEINYTPPTLKMKFRRVIGSLRRGKLPMPFSKTVYDFSQDREYIQTNKADLVSAPSKSLGNKLIAAWHLDPDKVWVLPSPYLPSAELLKIPIESQFQRITFIGRLEVRKGILDLADAIPVVLKRYPKVLFRFVGPAWPSPEPEMDMRQYLLKRLRRYRENLEFSGAVTPEQIPKFLAETDICVFPSRWENFPNVCLEAMAAGRGIVASNAGGMTDMLASGNAGYLVPPKAPSAIALAICKLISDPSLRMRLGKAARARVLAEYSSDKIGDLQEASYKEAIKRRHTSTSRRIELMKI
ncbi:MAG: glycosyltransferase family 4 protein [Phormidesmis sp.]